MLDDDRHWLEPARNWHHRLTESGLYGPVQAIAEAARPLAPLMAQFVWFIQPAFALIGKFNAVGRLAELLENPDSLALLAEPSEEPTQTKDR